MNDKTDPELVAADGRHAVQEPLLVTAEVASAPLVPAWWHWTLVLAWCVVWFLTEPGLVVQAKRGFEKYGAMQWLPLLVVLTWQFSLPALLGAVLGGRKVRSLPHPSRPPCPLRRLTARDVQINARAALRPSALNGLNFVAQGTQMSALLFGSMSFTQMVRAAEPVFLLFWSLVFSGCAKTPVALYFASVPIYVGVVLCGMTELHLSWFALGFGMLSNLLLTGRNAIAKKDMAGAGDETQRVTPGWTESVTAARTLFDMSLLPGLTCCALLVLVYLILPTLPLSMAFEPSFIMSGLLFAVMRHSSTVLLRVFTLLEHSLVKLSRRFIVIFAVLWAQSARPAALNMAGLAAVLGGAGAMDLARRFPRWWLVLASYAASAVLAVAVYFAWPWVPLGAGSAASLLGARTMNFTRG